MDSPYLTVSSLLTWRAILIQVFIAAFSIAVWRRYLSPLADIPGPFVASFTRWWHIRRIYIGDQNLQLVAMHEKYGHFVRIAPNEVSVSHPDGIRQILLQPLRKVSRTHHRRPREGIPLTRHLEG